MQQVVCSGDIPLTTKAAIGDMTMPKIRVPERLIPQFKDFCKRFARNLEPETGIRLRGNHLLNTVAQACQHEHYKDLLMDSATYGDGPFSWDALPITLAKPLADQLSVSAAVLWKSLMHAVVDLNVDTGDFTADVQGDLVILPDGSKYPRLKSAAVQRDEYGMWYHRDWPDFDEDTPLNVYESWKLANQIEFEVQRFEDWASDEQWEAWMNEGEDSGFMEWVPVCDKPGAFLAGIYDTEDGPIASFAVPSPSTIESGSGDA